VADQNNLAPTNYYIQISITNRPVQQTIFFGFSKRGSSQFSQANAPQFPEAPTQIARLGFKSVKPRKKENLSKSWNQNWKASLVGCGTSRRRIKTVWRPPMILSGEHNQGSFSKYGSIHDFFLFRQARRSSQFGRRKR